MNNTSTNQFITDWVIRTVKENYADDIALVISHTTLRIHQEPHSVSYFVPITDKGRTYAQTFILEGIGTDIWGMDWSRLERYAALEEYNLSVLADAQILYARTPQDRQRFEDLKKLQEKNLADPLLRRAHALKSFARAKEIYQDMLFANDCDAKAAPAYTISFLAMAICYSQGGYFKHSQMDQLAELQKMGALPDGFAKLYNAVILETQAEHQKRYCFELIRITEQYLSLTTDTSPKEYNFQDLADWYAELAYTWLRIRHYCAMADATKAFMWGGMLQHELNGVCEDFGLPKMDLLSRYDPENLPAFAAHADSLEIEMRRRILEGGGIIRDYKTREEFLHEI